MQYREPRFTIKVALELVQANDDGTAYEYSVKDIIEYSVIATCPHCKNYFNLTIKEKFKTDLDDDIDQYNFICSCPDLPCKEIIYVSAYVYDGGSNFILKEDSVESRWVKGNIYEVFPVLDIKYDEISEYIPLSLREDYYIAQKVLEISPELSAIKSRLLIEKFIKERLNIVIGKFELISLIKEFIRVETTREPAQIKLDYDLLNVRLEVPSDVIDSLAIHDYEKEAAYYNLNLIFDLFNVYYIYPAQRKKFQNEVKSKLNL